MTRRLVGPTVLTLSAMLTPLVGGGCGDDPARRDDRGRVVDAGAVTLADLRPGDCFDDPARATVSNVRVVPCAQSHQVEVLDLMRLDDGSYPGRERLHRTALDGCEERFVDLVGMPAEEAGYFIDSFDPTPTGWEGGDRDVVCLVALPGLASVEGELERLS